MTSITISKKLDLSFIGRNGSGHMCGAKVFAYGDVLDIRPITSRGNTGHCSIPIPVDQVTEFVEALRSAARELKPTDVPPDRPGTVGLTTQFGVWGEHPKYPRSDWQYLVRNGDTQRGYWEHVAACIDQEESGTPNFEDKVKE